MITHALQEIYHILPSSKSLIGIDYGLKKIGIAVSSPNQLLAMPLEVFTSPNDETKIQHIEKIANKYQACTIILGYPLNMDGTTSDQSLITEKFAVKLAKTGLPIYMRDERLSSKAANSYLKTFGIKRQDRNRMDDKVAASMILETFLESILKIRNSVVREPLDK